MSRCLLILFVVSISLLVYSVGLESYLNNSLVSIYPLQRCYIPCYDTDEVEWRVNAYKPKYSIQVESPNRKNLIMEKPGSYNTGVYTCVSKKNPDVFINVVLHIKKFSEWPSFNDDAPLELC